MSGAFASPGLIGGLVGLGFGIADWLIFTFLIVPKLEGSARQSVRKGQKRALSLPVLQVAFFLSCFVAFPIVGYGVGQLAFPDFGVAAGG